MKFQPITCDTYGVVYHNLPAEYQEVTYIQGTGTQYLVTDYSPNQNTIAEVKFLDFDTSLSTNNSLFGFYTNSGDYNAFYCRYQPTEKTFFAGNGKGVFINFGMTNMTSGKIKISHDSIYINDELYITIPNNPDFTSTAPIAIFAITYPSAYDLIGSSKIQYLNIYEGNTLVRQYIPCYRISDSVKGMYDTVNGGFLTNQGTGTFQKGADIYSTSTNAIVIAPNTVQQIYLNNLKSVALVSPDQPFSSTDISIVKFATDENAAAVSVPSSWNVMGSLITEPYTTYEYIITYDSKVSRYKICSSKYAALPVTITVTGNGVPSKSSKAYASVTIDGTAVSSAGTYIVTCGSEITLSAVSNRSGAVATITINGTSYTTKNATLTKTYNVTTDCSIALSLTGTDPRGPLAGIITLTTA